ncbi:peptidase E-like [Chelonoidis abingdonii]|uniref:peptidase E-like n=1 Tax=Chelonoidis abingdonii TaxID=106734 RepID=UPI003F490AAB
MKESMKVLFEDLIRIMEAGVKGTGLSLSGFSFSSASEYVIFEAVTSPQLPPSSIKDIIVGEFDFTNFFTLLFTSLLSDSFKRHQSHLWHHKLSFLLQCCFILQDGIPYMESSAGTNVASISISTTSDMPIMYLPSLQVLGLVPFNISPHYLDPDVNSTHMGETRAEWILQYHEELYCANLSILKVMNSQLTRISRFGAQMTAWGFISCQIQGLGEGAMLLVEGDKATLQGVTEARLFLRGEKPTEHEPGTDFSFLLIVTPRSPDLSCSETPDAKGR